MAERTSEDEKDTKRQTEGQTEKGAKKGLIKMDKPIDSNNKEI